MNNLFLSFVIAIGGAVGLVLLSRALNIEFFTSRIFPLIPILYALAYQALEKVQSGRATPIPPAKAKDEMKAGATRIFHGITAPRIFAAVGISIAIKFLLELFFTLMYVRFSGRSFVSLYGAFGVETIGRFLKGEHPWLVGNEGLSLLILLSVIASFGTGLWIGYTARGRAILEGVLVGAIVTIFSAMTNMLILYRKIEEMANEMALSTGHGVRIGFFAVLALKVLLYGFWSGIAQKANEEREARKAAAKSVKKSVKKAARRSKK